MKSDDSTAVARKDDPIQRLFALSDDAYKAFLSMLDAPAKPARALRTRMKRIPAWQR